MNQEFNLYTESEERYTNMNPRMIANLHKRYDLLGQEQLLKKDCHDDGNRVEIMNQVERVGHVMDIYIRRDLNGRKFNLSNSTTKQFIIVISSPASLDKSLVIMPKQDLFLYLNAQVNDRKQFIQLFLDNRPVSERVEIRRHSSYARILGGSDLVIPGGYTPDAPREFYWFHFYS